MQIKVFRISLQRRKITNTLVNPSEHRLQFNRKREKVNMTAVKHFFSSIFSICFSHSFRWILFFSFITSTFIFQDSYYYLSELRLLKRRILYFFGKMNHVECLTGLKTTQNKIKSSVSFFLKSDFVSPFFLFSFSTSSRFFLMFFFFSKNFRHGGILHNMKSNLRLKKK